MFQVEKRPDVRAQGRGIHVTVAAIFVAGNGGRRVFFFRILQTKDPVNYAHGVHRRTYGVYAVEPEFLEQYAGQRYAEGYADGQR